MGRGKEDMVKKKGRMRTGVRIFCRALPPQALGFRLSPVTHPGLVDFEQCADQDRSLLFLQPLVPPFNLIF